MLAIADQKIIKAHELYPEGSEPPSIQDLDSIIFVLNGEVSAPEKFLKLFKNHYQRQYDGKKLVFLHSNGGHWTTYECDYKYDKSKDPEITRHEIRGDGRCGLHAVAKALAIVSGKQGLVEERELHENKQYQIPDNVRTDDGIFAHLGLNKSDLQNVWIGRVVKKDPKNPGTEIVEKQGTKLIDRILQLQAKSAHEDWLSSEDIDNILIHTDIGESGGKRFFLASMDEQFKMKPEAVKEELQNEVFRAILDDKNWKCESTDANKMDNQKYINAQSHDKFPEKMKKHFNNALTDNTTRSNALKEQLQEYQDFDYSKIDGDKISVTDVDKFDHIPNFPEKEKFLRFVVDNHGLFDDDLKGLIRKTLMFLKIKNMVQGGNQSDKSEYSLNFPKNDDALNRCKKNDLFDNLLELYSENSEEKAIDEDKKTKLKNLIHEVYSDAPAIIPERVITVEKVNATTIETKKGGAKSQAVIKKLNSIDYEDFDKEKLKNLRFLKITGVNNEVEVKKVVVDSEQGKTTLVDFVDDKKYQEVVCYSEYVKYADDKSVDKKDVTDFFALQPKKYQGYGLKIRLEAEGDLFFDGCFNDAIKKDFNGKDGRKILKINGESIKTHLAMATKLGIEAKYYINALFRASDDPIDLEFDDKSVVKLQLANKKVFEQKETSTYQTVAETINVEQEKEKMDKLMIGKPKSVTFDTGVKRDAPAVTALTGNAKRAIDGIEGALNFNGEELTKAKHFDWWFVNDFLNGSAGGLIGDNTGIACTYSNQEKQSLLGNSDYLEKSLDLANKYFDELLIKKGEKEEIYGIRLIKIYNYLTILQNDKDSKGDDSLLKDGADLGKKLSGVLTKLETAIGKNYQNDGGDNGTYKNDGGDNGTLNHDGLKKNIKKLVVDDAKQKTYHEILKNKTPAIAPRHPGAGLVDPRAPGIGL